MLPLRLLVALTLVLSGSRAIPLLGLKLSCLGHCIGAVHQPSGSAANLAAAARSPILPADDGLRRVAARISQSKFKKPFGLGLFSSSKKLAAADISSSSSTPTLSRSSSSASSMPSATLSRSTSGHERRGDFAWADDLHVSPERPRSPPRVETTSDVEQRYPLTRRPSFAARLQYGLTLDRISEATTPAMSSHVTPHASPLPVWIDQGSTKWPWGQWKDGKVVTDLSSFGSPPPLPRSPLHAAQGSSSSSSSSPTKGRLWELLKLDGPHALTWKPSE